MVMVSGRRLATRLSDAQAIDALAQNLDGVLPATVRSVLVDGLEVSRPTGKEEPP
jgi:hypothetical protein